jgi:hypothetical protein
MGGRTTKSNVPNERLRWTVERAGIEFGLSTGTLRKALNKNSAAPDADGLFSTQQVTGAIYGSMYIEKLATQKELRRKLELENAVTTASVLNRAELMKAMAAIADAFVSRVMAVQGLSRQEKEDLLKELSSWPIVLEDVARRQSRLPARGKRRHHEEDESEDPVMQS